MRKKGFLAKDTSGRTRGRESESRYIYISRSILIKILMQNMQNIKIRKRANMKQQESPFFFCKRGKTNKQSLRIIDDERELEE